MAPSNVTLPKGSLILVSGATGYIGSHVVDQFLNEGYNVRGTVRAPKPWLDEMFTKKYGKGRYESVIVPSIDADSAFDEAIKGVAGVVHVASDITFRDDPYIVVPVAVKGVTAALEAAAKTPSVKRFVLTSSSAAAHIPSPNNSHVVVDQNSWNDAMVAAAYDPDTPAAAKGSIVYAASKVGAEKAAWAFVKERKPSFVLNVVLPNLTLGPVLDSHISGSTFVWLTNLLKGDKGIMGFPTPHHIDVVDAARLHVAALLDPEVHDERVMGFGTPFNWTDIVGLLRRVRPDNKLIPDAPENEGRDEATVKDRARAEGLLKSFFDQPHWTNLEDSIVAGLKSMNV
ncbi:hypothetical protein G7046_g1471 [Stylonectria norvegica]|nr:hypothetical protein G7046_g1471 [Stylonectria norvegica]